MSEDKGISNERQYEFVTTQIRYHDEKIIESFKLFIQVLSAIVGGSIFLAKEPSLHNPNYGPLATILVWCLGAMTIITVSVNTMAWFGFRKAEHRLNPKAPQVRHLWSYWNELAMLIVICIAVILFTLFNPL